MERASINDIDALPDLTRQVDGLMDSWEEAAQELGRSIEERLDELSDRLGVFTQEVEESRGAVQEATRDVENAESALSNAQAELASCEARTKSR